MTTSLTPASLDENALEEIRRLEKETDTVLVALKPAPALADLDTRQLGKIRDAEKRLGVVMVAYDA
jgi:hypothetical protein